MKTSKMLDCWRPMKIGQRVRLTTKWRARQVGTITHKYDDRIDGLGRYSVKLDSCPDLTTDVVRCELTKA